MRISVEELNLSKRLRLIASLIKSGSRVADIGTDHGYLPIFLVKNQISDNVIAMDVRKGPLNKAKINTQAFGVEKQIELRLSDGLAALEKEEADVITISGMGGKLIQSILNNGMDRLTKKTKLILSPQSELRDFRRFLKDKGFLVFKEHMMKEDGQFYVIIECVYMGADYTPNIIEETKLRYGEELLLEQNESLKEYLFKEKKITEGIYCKLTECKDREGNVKERLKQLQNDLECIDFALEYYN